MPTFEFQAYRTDGSLETGNIVGASLEAALGDLSRRGLQVEKISVAQMINDPLAGQHVPGPRPEASPRSEEPLAHHSGYAENPQGQRALPDLGRRSYVATNVVGPVVAKMPLAGLGFFFRQFGTMLNAGVPIVQSLETLTGQAKHPMQKQMVGEMALLAKEGLPISQAMQRYPESITPVMISMIRAGEEGGFLDSANHQVADYIDREVELINLYKRSTFYPKLVFFASFIVIGACNFIIGAMGKQGGLTSPISLSVWMVLAGIFVGVWLFFKIGLTNHGIKFWWDKFVLGVPVYGKTMHQLSMARFGRALGALYKAGVPVSKALPLSADACGNEFLRAKMYPLFRRVEEGGGIFEALRDTQAFSPIVLDMIMTGEKTGNMEQMVTKVAEYYEQETVTRQNALALASGMVLFLIVAIYVGIVVVTNYQNYGNTIQQASSDKEN